VINTLRYLRLEHGIIFSSNLTNFPYLKRYRYSIFILDALHHVFNNPSRWHFSPRLFSQAEQLKLSEPVPVTLHPAAVYLSSLSEGSRRAMLSSLNAIARLLTEGECDAFSLDWSKLRYHHTAAIRTALKQRLAPATTNKMLVALRRVLTDVMIALILCLLSSLFLEEFFF
jgi:hypothetical protein